MQANGELDRVLDSDGQPFSWPVKDIHPVIDLTCRLKGQRCIGAWAEDGRIGISAGGFVITMSRNDWEVVKNEVDRSLAQAAK